MCSTQKLLLVDCVATAPPHHTPEQRFERHCIEEAPQAHMAAASGEENFGDRPQKLIAAFQQLDKKGSKKIPIEKLMQLLTKFDTRLTAEEQNELLAEIGDRSGTLEYEPFVKNVVFGKV
jgi:hypothetical protein